MGIQFTPIAGELFQGLRVGQNGRLIDPFRAELGRISLSDLANRVVV